MKKEKIISIALPITSLLIVLSLIFFLNPTTTGLAILEPNGTKLVNADVTLTTKSSEIIPPDAIVEVWIDEKSSAITVAEFIQKTGKEYEVKKGDLSRFGYIGPGFTGDHTYNLTLADFDLDRDIGKGEHIFKTRIIFRRKLLYEKESRIMISE